MARRKKRAAKRSPQSDRPTGRFTAKEKAEILKQIDSGRTKVDVAEQYATTTMSIRRWEKAREAARQSEDANGKSGLVARSTRPLTSPGAGLRGDRAGGRDEA